MTKQQNSLKNNYKQEASGLRDKSGQFTKAGAKKYGEAGGESTSEKHGRGFYRKIGKKGADERWGQASEKNGKDQ